METAVHKLVANLDFRRSNAPLMAAMQRWGSFVTCPVHGAYVHSNIQLQNAPGMGLGLFAVAPRDSAMSLHSEFGMRRGDVAALVPASMCSIKRGIDAEASMIRWFSMQAKEGCTNILLVKELLTTVSRRCSESDAVGWARRAVMSRCHFHGNASDTVVTYVPLLDFTNHSGHPSCAVVTLDPACKEGRLALGRLAKAIPPISAYLNGRPAVPFVALVALRDISSGEQLTYLYDDFDSADEIDVSRWQHHFGFVPSGIDALPAHTRLDGIGMAWAALPSS